MPIDDSSKVDGIGTDSVTGTVVLMISDHLDWSDERAHLEALRSKVNAYLDFIQSGQIHQASANARTGPIRIDILAEHPAPESTAPFFRLVEEIVAKHNVGFEYKKLPDGVEPRTMK